MIMRNNRNENTGILLKVHTSNFKIYGFTEEVDIESLVKLGNDRIFSGRDIRQWSFNRFFSKKKKKVRDLLMNLQYRKA